MIFSLAKKSILIVEDFAEFARSVRAMLSSMGAKNIDIVYNAEDAIETCKARKYDVILSDYNLGQKKDGQQLLEELSKYHLLKSNCVFLMLTAENTSTMVMGAVEFQPDGYIAKPFTGNLLKSRLQKATDKKDALHPISRAIANKQWEVALDNIDKVSKENPKYKMSCLRLKYKTLKNLKQLDKALELVTKIVSQRTIPWAMQAVGEVFYLQKDFKKALDIFKKVTTEFPMALEGYDWLAKVQHELGQPIDAQTTLTKAIEKSPKALQRQKNLGSLAEENNDLSVMTKAYREAVKYSAHSAFSSPEEYLKLTTALTRQINEDPASSTDAATKEAEQIFGKLEKAFSSSGTTKLRSSVAKAQLYKANKNEEKQKKHLADVEKNLLNLDEQISANISLELSESLKELGSEELSDEILNEAIQQNLDDPKFIEKASKLSNNQELINLSKQAGKYNTKAINYFKNKKITEAINYFKKANKIAPTNINICLNYVQARLKQAQSDKQNIDSLHIAEKILSAMPNLNFSDPRYARYSELNRLIQLMLQERE